MEKITHHVKSWETFYRDILTGKRTSDIRLNDRRYAVGDHMLLQEFDPIANSSKGDYTGRNCLVVITYIQNSKSNPCAISHRALHDDYVVLSIKLVQ